MIMPGRKFGTPGRFGFNGQEQDNEIYGAGNSYTAEFWQYDPRLGRRWNVDPVVTPWMSRYAVFLNSPISFSDANGDMPEKPIENWKRNSTYTYRDGTVIFLVDNIWVLERQKYTGTNNPELSYWYWDDVSEEWLGFIPVSAQNTISAGAAFATMAAKLPIEVFAALTGADDAIVIAGGIHPGGDVATSSDKNWAKLGAALPIVSGKMIKWIANLVGLADKYGYGKCVEFAYDFGRKALKYSDKTGETVKRFEINIGKNGMIGTATDGFADNGMHQFIEVYNKELGVTMIFDNFYRGGIPKSEYLEKIGGYTRESGSIDGKTLLETFTKEIPVGSK